MRDLSRLMHGASPPPRRPFHPWRRLSFLEEELSDQTHIARHRDRARRRMRPPIADTNAPDPGRHTRLCVDSGSHDHHYFKYFDLVEQCRPTGWRANIIRAEGGWQF
jgi:hypothetical protein